MLGVPTISRSRMENECLNSLDRSDASQQSPQSNTEVEDICDVYELVVYSLGAVYRCTAAVVLPRRVVRMVPYSSRPALLRVVIGQLEHTYARDGWDEAAVMKATEDREAAGGP